MCVCVWAHARVRVSACVCVCVHFRIILLFYWIKLHTSDSVETDVEQNYCYFM